MYFNGTNDFVLSKLQRCILAIVELSCHTNYVNCLLNIANFILTTTNWSKWSKVY